MVFRLHQSNRSELLVARLAEVVDKPLTSPLAPECIVVEGRGMERWLSLQLAQTRHRVWANPDFVYPRRIVVRALVAVLGEHAQPVDDDPIQPEVVTWAIAALLPSLLELDELAPIARYLDGREPGSREHVALCQRLARVFDDYLVYRPELLLSWEEGKEDTAALGDDAWQPVLWRALVDRLGAAHMARLELELRQALARGARPEDRFPQRLSLFGLATLAPLYFRILAALSSHVDVHLFLLSPTPEYWSDVQTRREQRARARRGEVLAEEPMLGQGNPLLAAWGGQGRDFLRVLDGLGVELEHDDTLYQAVDGMDALSTLQRDIYQVAQRRSAADSAPESAVLGIAREDPLPLAPDDSSLSVHVCHGPMREIEVLHDQLLALFDDDAPGLQPSDVVVMAPDIDAYVPFIDAVFGGPAQQPRLRYDVADRGIRVSHPIIDALFGILRVLQSRLSAPEVLELLDNAACRQRAGIDLEQLPLLRRWVDEAGVRWGVDATDRARHDNPAEPLNTWRFGLDRLLLGYAMASTEQGLYRNVLPYDDVEGSAAEALGRFVDWCETLFSLRMRVRQTRTIKAWRALLLELTERLLATSDDTSHEHDLIDDALASLETSCELAGHDAEVTLDAILAQLEPALDRARSSRGFLTGGITFCSIVPMRAIPFRVVALVGMDDGAFPRQRRRAGFDLIARAPRPGDRSQREDDRYLFLETLLSTRERLIITYSGLSPQDNAAQPPSVVVSDLLDVVDESFVAQAGQDCVREQVVLQHPLQAFSPRYFGASDDARLFSYRRGMCHGSRRLHGKRTPAPPFLPTLLPPTSIAEQSVTIRDLSSFYQSPQRFLLQRQPGLYLDQRAELLASREPMALDNLQRWQLGQELLIGSTRGATVDQARFGPLRASGRLPHGELGHCVFDEVAAEAGAIASALPDLSIARRLDPISVELDVHGVRLSGVLDGLWPEAQIKLGFSRLNGKQLLDAWIAHLALCAAAPPDHPRVTWLLARGHGKDGAPAHLRLEPVTDPVPLLGDLLGLYQLGLRAPLPLLPKASWTYALFLWRTRPDSDLAKAYAEALKLYRGNSFAGLPGEEDDPSVKLLFGGADLQDPRLDVNIDGEVLRFAELAQRVFEPIFAHGGDAA